MADTLFWTNRIIESGAASPQELAKGMHPLNWRGHPENQRQALEEALDSLGILQPVLFNKSSGRVIDGHLRIELAVLKGQPLIPVNYVELTDDEEALALATLDAITEQAEPIAAQLAKLLERTKALTADRPGLAGMLEELRQRAGVNGRAETKDAEPQIDKAGELAKVWGTQLGQIWELGAHRLAVGDCTDKATVEAVMRGERAQACVTDPPYGVEKAQWDDVFPDRAAWLIHRENLSAGANVLIFPGEINLPHKVSILFEIFNYQWPIIWYKPNAMQFGKTGYTVQSIAWWLSVDEPIKRPKCRDVIVDAIVPKNNDFGHPSPKNIAVIETLVNEFSGVDDTVFEPYSGSGTTIIAAQNLNRKARAIELDIGYAAVTLQRFFDATGIEPRLTS